MRLKRVYGRRIALHYHYRMTEHSATKVITVAAKAAEQTAAKSPFPVLGILAGVLALRRQ